MAAKSNYNESNIQILEGLEAVRKRPGMYIGSTDARGLHHLVWEIVDNAIDEALSGFGDNIQVVICKDNSIEVSDHGRGMPTGMHASGRPATEVILTILHAGGKFNEDGGYKTSGGLHGVGASVVNALSSWLEVTIYREGKIWSQRFENGGSKIGKLKVIGKTNKTGTTIHFLPDANIFSVHEYNFSTISERLMESAFLLKGIKIDLKDERNNKEVSYQYDNGLTAFVEYLNYEKEILNPIINIEGTNNGIEVDVAMQFTAGYQENTLSFVNLVRTGDGGTHETGFRVALTRTFNEYARKYGLLKEKDKNLEGNDVREGLSAIISIKVPEHFLQFEGQTKSKLGTPEARNVVDNVVYEKLSFYLEENKETADTLVKKMIKAAQVRDAARKAREAARKGKGSKQERILSGKLAPAQSKDKKRKELYLVEGDSAGGSAKQGRDRKYQAILPLRGKVVNTEKAAMSDILKNEEIATIINTIGAGVGADFNEKDSNYSKVIIMTDADTDGAHIQILLLTFFYRYMRELIIAGKVYIALPPLYKISKKNGKKEDAIYAWEDDELEEAKKKIGRGYNIQRYKGLGEMNANQLWETTMNPETRTLIQVSIDDAAIVERRVSVLMGDKVEPRR
ncbi:DNA topoisomerase IV subunit B, partial [Thomasclavelia cocleata]